MDQYYTTGEFARMAHVTIRTIRYYDKKGLLKPSFINESGYRMYSDEDFLKLQKEGFTDDYEALIAKYLLELKKANLLKIPSFILFGIDFNIFKRWNL